MVCRCRQYILYRREETRVMRRPFRSKRTYRPGGPQPRVHGSRLGSFCRPPSWFGEAERAMHAEPTVWTSASMSRQDVCCAAFRLADVSQPSVAGCFTIFSFQRNLKIAIYIIRILEIVRFTTVSYQNPATPPTSSGIPYRCSIKITTFHSIECLTSVLFQKSRLYLTASSNAVVCPATVINKCTDPGKSL